MIKFSLKNAIKFIRYNKKSSKILFIQNIIIFLLIFLFSGAQQFIINDIKQKYAYLPNNTAKVFRNTSGLSTSITKDEIESFLTDNNISHQIRESIKLTSYSDSINAKQIMAGATFEDIKLAQSYDDYGIHYNIIAGSAWSNNQNESEIEVLINKDMVNIYSNTDNIKSIIGKTISVDRFIRNTSINMKVIGVYGVKQHIPLLSNNKKINNYYPLTSNFFLMSTKHFNQIYNQEIDNNVSTNLYIEFNNKITKENIKKLNALNPLKYYFESKITLIESELIKFQNIFNFLNIITLAIFIISIFSYLLINSNLLNTAKQDLIIRKLEGAKKLQLFYQIFFSALIVGLMAIIITLFTSLAFSLIIFLISKIWGIVAPMTLLYILAYIILIVIFSFISTLKLLSKKSLEFVKSGNN